MADGRCAGKRGSREEVINRILILRREILAFAMRFHVPLGMVTGYRLRTDLRIVRAIRGVHPVHAKVASFSDTDRVL